MKDHYPLVPAIISKNPSYIPADTEIRFISFGCEEAGLCSSQRYGEGHLDELKQLEARVLNFEVIAYPEITILTSELTSSARPVYTL